MVERPKHFAVFFDKCQKIIKNDIAMALTGENEYDIALAAVYTGDKEVAMGGDMTRLRPALVNSLFLVFALKCVDHEFDKTLESFADYSTKIIRNN